VLYARAAPGGLQVLDEHGRAVATRQRFALLVTQRAGQCGEGRLACGPSGCTSATRPPRSPELHDALVASP
jgi:hypothetical protein